MATRSKDASVRRPPTISGTSIPGWSSRRAWCVMAVGRLLIRKILPARSRGSRSGSTSSMARCTLLTHLLKWDHPAIRRSRGACNRCSRSVRPSPICLPKTRGSRRAFREAIAHCYRKARAEAANDAGLDENSFPRSAPMTGTRSSREFAA